jgi:hypothetical protein
VRVIDQGPSRRQSFPPSVHRVGELARTAGKSGQVMSKWAEVGRVSGQVMSKWVEVSSEYSRGSQVMSAWVKVSSEVIPQAR